MHICSCGKQYKRLKSFQEHRALCEMINLASANENKDHLLDTPSTLDMWLAVKMLINKNTKIRERGQKVTGVGFYTKKKTQRYRLVK